MNGLQSFLATVDLTKDVQEAMVGTSITLNQAMAGFPGAIYAVSHPLTENVVQVNCGALVAVELYVPVEMSMKQLEVFSTALKSAAAAHVLAVASNVFPGLPPRK